MREERIKERVSECVLVGPPTADRTATSAEWLRPEFTAGQTTPPLSAQHLFPMVDPEMFKKKEKGERKRWSSIST